jgi:hypothetical protein
MNPHYPRIAEQAVHRCEYCHAPENVFNSSFEVEHILPVSQGGADEEANLALACRICNLYKADFMTGYDEETQSDVRLFHPRQDNWDDHFYADSETGLIMGRTPIGRATIHRLQINSPRQITARQLWTLLGLFP